MYSEFTFTSMKVAVPGTEPESECILPLLPLAWLVAEENGLLRVVSGTFGVAQLTFFRGTECSAPGTASSADTALRTKHRIMLNVLVGIFVQEAGEITKWDKDLFVDGIVEKKEKQARKIAALFDSIDLERTGWLSLEKLSTSLENPRISFFEHLEVDVSEVEVLVRLLDLDGNGRITRE